jgi:hypothetical protein
MIMQERQLAEGAAARKHASGRSAGARGGQRASEPGLDHDVSRVTLLR